MNKIYSFTRELNQDFISKNIGKEYSWKNLEKITIAGKIFNK